MDRIIYFQARQIRLAFHTNGCSPRNHQRTPLDWRNGYVSIPISGPAVQPPVEAIIKRERHRI